MRISILCSFCLPALFGEYDVDFIYAKVEVTIQNGRITTIHILEHRQERGKAAEVIADKIVDEQKIEVDAISGATNSNTVIKKWEKPLDLSNCELDMVEFLMRNANPIFDKERVYEAM